VVCEGQGDAHRGRVWVGWPPVGSRGGDPPGWSAWAPFIASVELVISRIEAKVKMSQNRPPADIDDVITGLDARGDHAAAGAVRDAQHR
jgi:predicted FMN-binding regulatory protein PaiB